MRYNGKWARSEFIFRPARRDAEKRLRTEQFTAELGNHELNGADEILHNNTVLHC
jgi:hypothetical protein